MKLKYLSIIVLCMLLIGNTQCVEKYSFLDIQDKQIECSKQNKTFKLVYNKENIPVNYTCN